jgi:hypothetical protein
MSDNTDQPFETEGPSAAYHPDAPDGAELIADERDRQLSNGWVAASDDRQTDGQLLDCAVRVATDVLGDCAQVRRCWPHERATHVREKYGSDYIRRLTIAGALIAAEIDRLRRAGAVSVAEEMRDRRPLSFEDRWLWHPQPEDAPDEHQFDYLPREVFDRLDGFIPRSSPRVSRAVKAYLTREAATDALRRATAIVRGSLRPGGRDARSPGEVT